MSFFRYFKVALDRECPFWPAQGQCARESCAVESCEEDEVPAPWLEEERNRSAWSRGGSEGDELPSFLCGSGSEASVGDAAVDRSRKDIASWEETGGDEVWIEQPADDVGMVYIDLLKNPEGMTGYDGEPARRVWRAIYDENCFDLFEEAPPKERLLQSWRDSYEPEWVSRGASLSGGAEPQCLERRVFFKLVSGLQASISTHIAISPFSFWDVVFGADGLVRRFSAFVGAATERCLDSFGASRCEADEDLNTASGPMSNDALFLDRVGSHEDRLNNLYFAYLFVLRAVSRAKVELATYDYDTGNATDDAVATDLVARLVDAAQTPPEFAAPAGLPSPGAGSSECAAAEAARAAFDETLLFRAPDDPRMSPLERALARESVEELRAQFVGRFRNISAIMDCVTCERCRLWGKLQFLGLGTALKILLMDGDEFGVGVLQRNEVVALVNTLAQLAKSVDSIRDWQKRDVRKAQAKLAVYVGLAAFAALAALALVHLRRRRRRSPEKPPLKSL